MGLFRGFKDKLIGGKEKKIKDGKHEVVCVKFNTFSEFQRPVDVPSCSNDNPGRNEVIKERKRPVKPEVKNVFDQNRPKANGSIPKAEEKSAPPVVWNRVKVDSPKITTNGTASKVRPESSLPELPPEGIKPAKKIAAPKPPTTKSQAPAAQSRKAPAPAAPAPVKKPVETPNFVDLDEDDGNFQIHFASNVKTNLVSNYDDDGSEQNDGVPSAPFKISSQATSIFFGGEEEPAVARPRNFVFDDDDNDDDDLSDGSSASA